jgi:FtsZ-binding cell division protein ZapB
LEVMDSTIHLETAIRLLEYRQGEIEKLFGKIDIAIDKLTDIQTETNKILSNFEQKFSFLEQKIQAIQNDERQLEMENKDCRTAGPWYGTYIHYILAAVLLIGWFIGLKGGSIASVFISLIK